MRPRLARAAWLCACLSACTTVGRDYRVPDHAAVRATVANGPLQSAQAPDVAIAPVPDDWWRLYDDDRLDRLVTKALAANTDIRAASANLRRALALLHEVEAENLPQGSAGAGVSRAQLSGESYLQQAQPPVFNLGDLGLGASYLVDLFGKLARADEAALAGAQASEATLDMVRVTVAAQTVRAYVQGCAASHDLHAATRQLAVQQHTLDATRRLFAAGRAGPAEVAREHARSEALRAALAPLQAARSAARYRLALLLGEPPGALPQAEVACEAEPVLRAPLPVGDGAALLRRRPDVRQAERELAAATARIGVATADLYPSIRIGASAGLTGVLSHLGSAATARWSLGPLLSWTWPTNGVRHRIRGQEAAADAALARFDGVVLRALQETETALAAYTRELERHAALHAAAGHAAQAARQQRRLWAAGRLPYLAQLDAERDLAAAQAALASSAGQVAARQVDLFLALGGGWQSARKLAAVPRIENEKND
ncbi:RND efflux system, outer membrane lipoprotein, NodT family [Cupriavidus taiwanensis]|uniref:RND efflux system, outer membrane lipoprotein, NodT family n=1 Tax=Cupriavidus taiwanensis TaxID=164546 RepID=A0A975XBP6_9BURK|nr:efflux transporter outer membrane subunit [Cupriavidus taiwanensis]SOY64287.1 RND efflux system, outer membrane lipoprotein, NodT family [Cupriavidus taiwanensis]